MAFIIRPPLSEELLESIRSTMDDKEFLEWSLKVADRQEKDIKIIQDHMRTLQIIKIIATIGMVGLLIMAAMSLLAI